MKAFKIAAIILIITAGSIGSYLIIKNSSASQFSEKNAVSLKNSANSIYQNPIKWIEEKIQSFNNSSSSVESNAESNVAAGNGVNTDNLTKLVAGSLFNQMKGLDAGGKNPFNGENFDVNDSQNQELIQKSLSDMQSNPSALFDAKVETKDLKISGDNSQKAKSDYLGTIGDISRARLGDSEYQMTADETINNFNNDCAASNKDSVNLKIAGAYAAAGEDYLKVYVPSDWAELHARIIAYFKKANLVYSALGNCFEDPIKGYLATQILPQLVSENKDIQNSLAEQL